MSEVVRGPFGSLNRRGRERPRTSDNQVTSTGVLFTSALAGDLTCPAHNVLRLCNCLEAAVNSFIEIKIIKRSELNFEQNRLHETAAVMSYLNVFLTHI